MRHHERTRPHRTGATWPCGKAGTATRTHLQRRAWRFPTERCCSSPALSRCCVMLRRWLGERRQVSMSRLTWCGPRIKVGAWRARSTRKSSSPSAAPIGGSPCPCQRVPGQGSTGAVRGRGSALPRRGGRTTQRRWFSVDRRSHLHAASARDPWRCPKGHRGGLKRKHQIRSARQPRRQRWVLTTSMVQRGPVDRARRLSPVSRGAWSASARAT